MLILNWGEKTKKVTDTTLDFCSICKRATPFEIRYEKKTAGAFFISVASWNKKYYLVCERCSNGFSIKQDKVDFALVKYSEAPEQLLATEIFREIEKFFIDGDYIKSLDFESFNREISDKLKEEYNKKDVEFVLEVFNKMLFATLKESTESK